MDEMQFRLLEERINAVARRIIEEQFKIGYAQIVAICAADGVSLEVADKRAAAIVGHVRDGYDRVTGAPSGDKG